MGALKRLTSAAFPTALGVAAIWLACMVALIPLQPKASQANKTYQLGTFTAFAYDLTVSLQNEMFLAARSHISIDNDLIQSLQAATRRTDKSRHNIAKIWGRFDSTPFGKPFRNQIEMAFTRLDAIDRARDPSQVSEADSIKVVRSYAVAIADFLRIETYVDELKISEKETGRLRKKFSNSLKLAQSMETEFLAGMGVLANEPLDDKIIAAWSAAAERRKALLQFSVSDAPPGPAPPDVTAGGVNSVLAAATLSDRFLVDAREGKTSDYPDKNIWITAYSTGLNTLLSIANDNRTRMTQRARDQAKHANVIFILAVVAAAVLTILVLAWRKHRNPGLLFLILFVSINIPFLWWGLTAGGEFLADEGGVLETAQAVTLIIALALFCSDAVKFDQPSRSVALILTCVCLFMFFREMDFRTFGAPDWIIGLSSGPGRRVLFFIGATAVMLYAIRHYRNLLALLPSGLSLRAWPFYIWPILLILGEAVEVQTHATRKDDLHGFWVSGQLWEEMLELDAYLVLAYAAYMFGDIIRFRSVKNDARQEVSSQKDPPGKSTEQPVE